MDLRKGDPEVLACRRPLPVGMAVRDVARCVAAAGRLLAQRRVHIPREHVGMRLRFADGSSARVYRETVVGSVVPAEPCLLVVGFRLRAVRGRGHDVFRPVSLLNTPLFVGFPGLVSKLWVAHDEHGVYRGIYEWDGPERARAYARALWRVLALVSVRGSIGYAVFPGLRRAEALADPGRLAAVPPLDAPDRGQRWWQPVATG
jgi:hypothetical protein